MISASGTGDFLGGVWDSIRTDVSSAFNTAQNNVRTDLANAANDVGADLANQAAAAIAPAGQRPVTIPLSANQAALLVIGGVVVVLVILYLAFRRKR